MPLRQAATSEELEPCDAEDTTEDATKDDKHVAEAAGAPPQPPPSAAASASQLFIAIVLYSLAASGMMIVNKLCLKEAHLPSFFGILQFAVAVLTVVILSAAGVCPRDDITLRGSRMRPYLLYSFIFVAVIYSTMQALLYASIATVIVFRATVPLVVCVLDWAFLGRQLPSKRSLLALLCVAGCAAGYVVSERELEAHGFGAYTWVIIYAFFISIEMAYAKHIVGPQLGFESIWGPVFHSNLLSIGTMAALMLLTSEHLAVARTVWTWRLCIYVTLSCATSVAISYAGWRCRSLCSASSFTVVGVGNKMLTVLVNSLVWDDHLSWIGAFCLFGCLVAACCYRQAPMRGEKAPAEQKTSLVGDVFAAIQQTRRAARQYLDLEEGSEMMEQRIAAAADETADPEDEGSGARRVRGPAHHLSRSRSLACRYLCFVLCGWVAAVAVFGTYLSGTAVAGRLGWAMFTWQPQPPLRGT